MRTISRLTTTVAGGLAAAMLAACSSYPLGPTVGAYPTTTTTYPVATMPMAGMEHGRIVNIEYLPVGTTAPRGNNILGAVVGGVAGALLGRRRGGQPPRAECAGRDDPGGLPHHHADGHRPDPHL
jgi:hypothetical protein